VTHGPDSPNYIGTSVHRGERLLRDRAGKCFPAGSEQTETEANDTERRDGSAFGPP
jgi:hypothetical protein